MEPEKKSSRLNNRFNYLVVGIVLALVGIIPLFFIPSVFIALPFAKAILLYGVVLVALCLWVIARLQEGKVSIPRHFFFVALALVPISYIASALFSGSRGTSFFGQGFETQTAGFIFIASLLTYITAQVFSSKKNITYGYLAFLAPFPLIALYHIARFFFGASFLSFGVFVTNTASLLGGWNDLGIYVGLVALFSFVTFELLPLERWMRSILIGFFVVSLFLLTVINFTLSWYVLGTVALLFFIYNFIFSRSKLQDSTGRNNISIISIIVIVVAIVFIMMKGNIYNTLSSSPLKLSFFNALNISNTEVRPSWMSTLSIAKHAYAQNPILGIGPNRFANIWQLWKPSDVNTTIFWSTDFNSATGFVPTSMITTGVVGLIAWLAFLGLLLYAGIVSIFKKRDTMSQYLTVSSLISALYLWVFSIMYIPSATILVLTFFFTGLFFASLIENGSIKTVTFDFMKDSRASFISVIVLILVIIGTLAIGSIEIKKFTSAFYFNKGLALANNNGKIDDVESYFNKAIQYNEADLYYRVLSNIALAKLNLLVLNQNSIASTTLQTQFTTTFASALSSAQQALALDPTNYQNLVAQGLVYDVLFQLGNTEAYSKAQQSYAQAAVLNPTNPAILLNLARLEVAHKDLPKAKDYIGKTLTLKGNYTDAIFLLSQIQVAEGDIKNAIKSVQAEVSIAPNDPGIYFELGLLYYNDKQYGNAAATFEQAIMRAPDYANAKYFLGLSYYRLNKVSEAIKQFQDIKVTNSDNKEVDLILTNLKANRDPFANVKAPLDNKPEKRAQLPIKESSNTSTTE